MQVFEHIPHVQRHIYKRTTMNEIVLFFTFDAISISERKDQIKDETSKQGLVILPSAQNTVEEFVAYMDGDVIVSFISSGVIVNIPSSKYRDFEKTKGVWERLSKIMMAINLNTIVWTFTKGNRLVFTNQLDETAKQKVLKIVFSEAMLAVMDNERIFVEESNDQKRTLTCRYGYEAFKDKTALSLKTMITTRSYSPENLVSDVMETNELMFDAWYWATGDELKKMMDKD